jgi:hypothetical protein
MAASFVVDRPRIMPGRRGAEPGVVGPRCDNGSGDEIENYCRDCARVYRETDSEGAVQKVVVTVTHETKKLANGIEAPVVHDVVTEGGRPTLYLRLGEEGPEALDVLWPEVA